MSTKSYLQRDKFPQCCGATILSGFGNTSSFFKQSGWPTKKEITKFLKEQPSLGASFPVENWHEMQKNAFHMAILNDGQKKVLHDLFIKAGFELVMSNHNAHSNCQNHLYVRKVAHEGAS
jgi:hypothetical protein